MVPHAMAMLLLSPAMAPPGDQWPHVSPCSAHSTHLWLRLSLSVIPDPGSNQPQSQLNSQPEGPWIPSSEIQKFKVWMSSKKTVLYRKVSLKVKSFLSSECVFFFRCCCYRCSWSPRPWPRPWQTTSSWRTRRGSSTSTTTSTPTPRREK